jgi:hypothetical protein
MGRQVVIGTQKSSPERETQSEGRQVSSEILGSNIGDYQE